MRNLKATTEEIRYIQDNLALGDRRIANNLEISLAVVRHWIKRLQPKKIGQPKKRAKFNRVSEKMESSLILYRNAKTRHYEKFPNCQICGNKESRSIHHIKGRSGKLLYDPDNLLTVCMSGSFYLSYKYPESSMTEGCHPWIERNLKLARELGYSKNKNSTT